MTILNIKNSILLPLFIIILTLSITGCQAKNTDDKESSSMNLLNEYVELYCPFPYGKAVEVKGIKPEKDKPFCLVKSKLFYHDYAENWDKAVTQSIYYAEKYNMKSILLNLTLKDYSEKENNYVKEASQKYKSLHSKIKMLISPNHYCEIQKNIELLKNSK